MSAKIIPFPGEPLVLEPLADPEAEKLAQLAFRAIPKLGLPAVSIEVSRARIHAELGTETVTEVLRLAFAARRAAPL